MGTSGVDMREFQEALREYLGKTEKALPEALNTKMFYIARGAHRGTPIADRAKIEQELGVVGYRTSVSKKTGNFVRRKAVLGGGALIYRIINGRRQLAGKAGLAGQAMKQAVARLIGKRLRSIGTERAGWLAIIRGFGSVINMFPSPRVKGKGMATVAKPGWSPQAQMDYDLNSFKNPGHRQEIDPRTVAALQASFNAEAQSMREYLSKKLQPIADQHNGRS